MSLRPFSAPWPEADVAPWVPSATAGIALLLGTCATLLVAHSRAAQLRFNAVAGLAAAAAAAACAVVLAHAGHDSAVQALPSSALALVAPQTLPGLAACAIALATFATLALLLLTAPKRVSRGGASKSKRVPPPGPASPRGGRRGTAASDSFSFGAAATTTVATPKLGSRAPAPDAAAADRKLAGRATFASRSPEPRPTAEPRAPAASPVTSPARGRPSTAKKGGAVRVASPKGRAAAPKEAAEVAVASPKLLKPTSGFASSRVMRR